MATEIPAASGKQLLELTDAGGHRMLVAVTDDEAQDIASLVWRMGPTVTRATLLIGACARCEAALRYGGSGPSAVVIYGPAAGERRALCAACAREEV